LPGVPEGIVLSAGNISNRGTRCGIMSPFNHGIGNDPGHDGADEADAQDDNDLMPLGTMIGDKSLEAQDFSGFILRSGKGELFAVGGSGKSFGHWVSPDFVGIYRSTGIRIYTILFRS